MCNSGLIKYLLDGNLIEAANTVQTVLSQRFDMYVTQELAMAKQCVRERHQGQEDKRYGLLASSKAKNLSIYGMHNDYNYTKNLRERP
jgi:Schlafen group 3, DNA/RNA helicase domain